MLPNMIDADMSGEIHRVVEDLGIQLHLNTALKGIQGKVEAEVVDLSDGSRIDLQPGRDMVMLAVGMHPDVDLFSPEMATENRGGNRAGASGLARSVHHVHQPDIPEAVDVQSKLG